MRLIHSVHSTRRSNSSMGLGFLGLLALMSLAIPAFAQSGANQMVSSRPDEDQPPVQVSIEASTTEVAPGSSFVLAVILDHDEHYHSNLNDPIVPEEMGDFYPVPTTLDLPEIDGLSFGAVHWPTPVAVDVDFFFTGNPISYQVYTEQAIIYIPVTIESDAALGERVLELNLGYQACNETICLPPNDKDLTVTIHIVESANTDAPLSATFDGYDSTQTPDSSNSSGASQGATNERRFLGLFVMPSSDSFFGVIILALSAAIGGFILNLTPCVLPVIPIKVMTISSHAGESKAKAFMLSMWMAIGVVTFWIGIGIPVAFISNFEFADPSTIFGIWWVTGIIGLVIALMSLGIMGLFQIKLPQKVYMVNPKADSAGGAFVFGLMTAVLGLPCFGFVAGALLAGAATMPSILVLTVFAFIGVGMAAPYVVLAMFPKLVEKLPRTGPASELIKHIMGLLMLAAAAYFLGTAVIAFGIGHDWTFPWWGKAVHWWAIGFVGLTTGLWLVFQTFKITKRVGPRLTYTVLGLVFAFSGSYVAYNQTMHQYHYFWQPYSPEFLATSLENGNVVVLDFTAEWCLNCKALEAKVLSRNPVKAELLSAGVIPMVADLTVKGTEAEKYRNEVLKQTGIPLLVIYAPGVEEPIWLSNAYTSAQVLDAIKQAKAQGKMRELVEDD